MARYAKAIIDINAFRSNFALARTLARPGDALAVIKADAYGHGAVALARALPEARMFAVASIDEATVLRDAGITTPLLLLGGFFETCELEQLVPLNLSVVIHSVEQLHLLLLSKLPAPVDVWLKLDSGMHRLGLPPVAFREAYQRLRSSKQIKNIVLMSHFACADQPTHVSNQRQTAVIRDNFAGFTAATSTMNSAALLTGLGGPSSWARPGIMLYGANPLPDNTEATAQLQPVMTLVSKLLSVRAVQAGDSIGYGQAWTASRSTRIGTVAMGYGDGYPRHAPPGTPVLVNGQRTELVGRVSMDLLTVDLSNVPLASVGDPVELWGRKLPVNEIATLANTISYALLTGVTARVPREYL